LVRKDVANEQVRAMSFIHPKFRARVKAHKTVIGDEGWFRPDELISSEEYWAGCRDK
jgi:hypothetical protein